MLFINRSDFVWVCHVQPYVVREAFDNDHSAKATRLGCIDAPEFIPTGSSIRQESAGYALCAADVTIRGYP